MNSSIDTYLKLCLLNSFSESKEIMKNKLIVKERMQSMLLIFGLTFVCSLLFFYIEIQLEQMQLELAAEVAALWLITLLLSQKSTRIINEINSSKPIQIVNDLYHTQLVMISIFLLEHIVTIQQVTFSVLSMQFITFQVMLSIFLINTLVSNQVKIIHCILMYLWLLEFTLKHLDQGVYQRIQLACLHGYVILNICFLYIQQTILVKSWQEQSERVQYSFKTMHDLRNYLQSYIELSKNVVGEGIKKLKINTNGVNTNTNTTISEFESNPSSQDPSSYQELSERKNAINENEDIKDLEMQQQFILQKVCFLYHLELIFEGTYTSKIAEIDFQELMISACKLLRIINMNKQNQIKLSYKSSFPNITVDNTIFEYFIVELTKFLHDEKYQEIIYSITNMVKNENILFCVSIYLPNLRNETIAEVNNKHVFTRLINLISKNNKFEFKQDDSNLYFNILIPYIGTELNRTINHSFAKSKRSPINSYIKKESKHSHLSYQKNDDKLNNSQKISWQSQQSKKRSHDKRSNGKASTFSHIIYEDTIYVKELKKQDRNTCSISEHSKKDSIPRKESIPKKESTKIEEIIIETTESKLSHINRESVSKKDTIERKFSKKSSKFKSQFSSKIDMIKQLASTDLESIAFEVTEGLVQINLDDEENILRMNKRAFKQEKAILNTVTNIKSFLDLILRVALSIEVAKTSTEIVKKQESRLALMCVVDHMLDCEQGWQAVSQARQINEHLELDITYVLLSSTEDKETLSKQEEVGVTHTICKPLNRSKLNPVLQQFKDRVHDLNQVAVVDI